MVAINNYTPVGMNRIYAYSSNMSSADMQDSTMLSNNSILSQNISNVHFTGESNKKINKKSKFPVWTTIGSLALIASVIVFRKNIAELFSSKKIAEDAGSVVKGLEPIPSMDIPDSSNEYDASINQIVNSVREAANTHLSPLSVQTSSTPSIPVANTSIIDKPVTNVSSNSAIASLQGHSSSVHASIESAVAKQNAFSIDSFNAEFDKRYIGLASITDTNIKVGKIIQMANEEALEYKKHVAVTDPVKYIEQLLGKDKKDKFFNSLLPEDKVHLNENFTILLDYLLKDEKFKSALMNSNEGYQQYILGQVLSFCTLNNKALSKLLQSMRHKFVFQRVTLSDSGKLSRLSGKVSCIVAKDRSSKVLEEILSKNPTLVNELNKVYIRNVLLDELLIDKKVVPRLGVNLDTHNIIEMS